MELLLTLQTHVIHRVPHTIPMRTWIGTGSSHVTIHSSQIHTTYTTYMSTFYMHMAKPHYTQTTQEHLQIALIHSTNKSHLSWSTYIHTIYQQTCSCAILHITTYTIHRHLCTTTYPLLPLHNPPNVYPFPTTYMYIMPYTHIHTHLQHMHSECQQDTYTPYLPQ